METFPLLALPYIPKVKILQFLDNAGHVKLQQTCRSMNSLVSRNRLKRKAATVRVTRRTPAAKEFVDYDIRVVRQWPEPEFRIQYRWTKSQPDSRPFFIWFAETFSKTDLTCVTLNQFDFGEEDMEKCRESWRQYRPTLTYLYIIESTFGNLENCVRFLSATHVRTVHIKNSDVEKTHVLLESLPFLNLVSSLWNFAIHHTVHKSDNKEQKQIVFKNLRLSTLPKHITQLSTFCDISHVAIIDFSFIKERIHKWWFSACNYLEVNVVCLPSQFRDHDAILEALELPVEISDISRDGSMEVWKKGRGYPAVRLTKTGNYFEASDAFEWRICVGVRGLRCIS